MPTLDADVVHFRRPDEAPFTRSQRATTTILFGGLSRKHDELIKAGLEGLGYKVQNLPTPDMGAIELGKMYGNNGQCNPTYFTVGNVVQYLEALERSGLSRREIADRYVFLTAGNACGTCRFAMYEAEHRLAVKNAGFDDFRVITFQISGQKGETGEDPGFEVNAEFAMVLLNAVLFGDMLNDVGYQIRPFELEPGDTDRALADSMDIAYSALRNAEVFGYEPKLRSLLGRFPKVVDVASYATEMVEQLFGDYYPAALRRIRDRLDQVKVDRTRVAPIVKITGEFWAHTTEGPGNFHMFEFLESEGAQVIVEPVGNWFIHNLRQAKDDATDRHGLSLDGDDRLRAKLLRKLRIDPASHKKQTTIAIIEKAFARKWNHLRRALDDLPHPLLDQYHLKELAKPFYSTQSRGGESHLEVAKNIYYHQNHLCHMVLGLKPFGCLPSTQSDGVQAKVVSHFDDMIYLPIETAGEGEVNAHSRVQMALGEARAKAREELARELERAGATLERVRAYVAAHPELERPFYRVPHHDGVVGVAANFVRHVGERMRAPS
jgi:predicted nucleotide-binding protein (sugar kinase/HSP70/actin superfamily)